MTQPVAQPQLLTLDEVAERVGVSIQTVYKWRSKRVFPPAVRLPNGSIRVWDTDLERWFNELGEAA